MSAVDWAAGSGLMTAGGKRLEYRCLGPAPDDADTIVLLHEGLGCVALWRDFPEKLAAETGCGVFAYSRAGHGQSDLDDLPRPIDFMTREAVAVLPQVLDGAGIRRAVLFGHSDGATIAAIHGGRVRDPRVRGLVLMAPHFFTEPMGLSEIAKTKDAFETSNMPVKMAKYHRDPKNTFYGWNGVWLHPDFEAWNVADVIDDIRVPVLAIQGRDDQYGTLAQIEEIEKRAHAPLDVEIIDACRHSPQFDQPRETLGAVAAFVARLERLDAEEEKTR
jgi:pimeloyl-ACP methyl ester carboxylesterase